MTLESDSTAGAKTLIPTPDGAGAVAIDEFAGRWWVLHTKARNEKAVAADLDRQHIRFFLPLVRRRHRYGRRSVQTKVPLFPGYVFLCGREEDRLAALKTGRVAHVLEVADQDRIRADLRQICRLVESDEPVDLYPRLRKGSRCLVRRGSLAGLEGVVLRRRGPWRVYVGVEFLGQSAELDIDPGLLELID